MHAPVKFDRGKKTKGDTIEYEETGWYDGQVPSIFAFDFGSICYQMSLFVGAL